MLTGLKDIDREVLKHVKDKELLVVCRTSKKMWYCVCDDNFIRRRLGKFKDIEKYKKENESWKTFFSRATKWIYKMKKEFDFDYSGGDFFRQYNIWRSENILVKAAEAGELDIIKHCVQKLIERIKEEAKKEGKMTIEKEEKLARIEADNIIRKSEIEKEKLGKKSLKNIDEVVKIVIKKVMEGK